MANYCIFRSEKLKSHKDVQLVLKEQHRAADYDSKRADSSQSFKNSYSSDYDAAIKKYDSLLPEKIRKNAVVGLNFMVTTSEEFKTAAEERAFYEKAREFIAERFGEVVGWAVHRDETSTHMQVVTIPLVGGKLNARALIGGDKHKMHALQDEFYERVGKPFGLERGKENPERHHKTVEEYHREQRQDLERREANLQEREKSLSDANSGLLERSKALDEQETRLNEKGAILSSYMSSARDNSLAVLKECEAHNKNQFHLPFDMHGFMKLVEKTVTGAWALVAKFQKDIEKLTKKNQDLERRLDNWRKTTPDELRDMASEYEKLNAKNFDEFTRNRQRVRTRSDGWSMSD